MFMSILKPQSEAKCIDGQSSIYQSQSNLITPSLSRQSRNHGHRERYPRIKEAWRVSGKHIGRQKVVTVHYPSVEEFQYPNIFSEN